MEQAHTIGKVYIIGAGPGDPELLTLKGARLLALAQVVLYDRLVSPQLLELAPSQALLIPTGKQKNGTSITQLEINNLLKTYALEGKTVIRLKGGDLSFFSNILDELQTLTQHNIPYELIPGVTAASGCAAYAGIPLTAREHSVGVRILTLHQVDLFTTTHWHELATSTDTLVFYMSSTNLSQLVANLLLHGAEPSLPLVIIEQGTTPHHKEYFSTLQEANLNYQQMNFISPALVIIGKVVDLGKQFTWYKPSGEGVYFKSLLPLKN